ncbi:DNA-binding transcriptional LysR family regulator [Actinocrispum wychmicini]|uniref:DNA-binding transcriptional LysR family regulator n=2 Tax=Actinocrispum wychmicini TaxID=1213861 RepID=A0A4R2KH86_9PSEU|nr:DNA-binding transcriptional LysR family regulator [Actinocrispum wychmicini]
MESMPLSHDFATPLLRVFVAVARLGSFTAAAPDLGYTQSAVSRQISALEEEAGTALFDRLPRGVRLTEPGRRLLGHAQAVLDRLDAARRDLANLQALTTGSLRVAGFATADAVLVPQAIRAFQQSYPDVQVTLREGFTPGLLAMVADGDVDVAVVSFPRRHHIDGFDLHKLRDDYMYVALPPGHALAGARQVRLKELVDENWIAGSTKPEDTLMSSCLRKGFQPKIGFVARDWMAKQGFVAAGVGVTLIPSLAVDACRPDISLVLVHPDDIAPRQIYAATASGITLSPAAQAFLDLLTPVDQ